MYKKTLNWLFPMVIIGFMLLFTVGCEESSDPDDDNINPPDTTEYGDTNLIPAGWKKVGNWTANDMIWSITSDASGNIYVGGYFKNNNGYNYVARWNGTSWSELGDLKANGGIFSLTTDASGKVYAVGAFTNGAVPNSGDPYVAMWDGSKWNDIGGGGGTFISADGVGNVYKERTKWDGSAWSYMCTDCPLDMGSIYSLIANASGTIRYAAGDIRLQNGYRYVAQCDGGNCWTQVGALNANADINTMVVDKDGNLYAAGRFTDGNLPTTGHQYVAKWDGSTWSKLGDLNANDAIYYLAADPVNGYIYASGYNLSSTGLANVVKWDGTSWSDMGNMRLSPSPIHVTASGKLYSVVAHPTVVKFTVVVHD